MQPPQSVKYRVSNVRHSFMFAVHIWQRWLAEQRDLCIVLPELHVFAQEQKLSYSGVDLSKYLEQKGGSRICVLTDQYIGSES